MPQIEQLKHTIYHHWKADKKAIQPCNNFCPFGVILYLDTLGDDLLAMISSSTSPSLAIAH